MKYHGQCKCGAPISGDEQIIICSECEQENNMVPEVPAEHNEAVLNPRRGQPHAEEESSKPRLPNADAAVVRYPDEDERDRHFKDTIERLTRGQRR